MLFIFCLEKITDCSSLLKLKRNSKYILQKDKLVKQGYKKFGFLIDFLSHIKMEALESSIQPYKAC